MPEPRLTVSGEYEDLELVTRFLNRQLDPERVKLVRQRLLDDPEFLDFAAPLLLAWSVPPEWQRTPRPPGELEKHWDEFTKRAGFVHQRRKARRRWITFILVSVAALALAGWTLRDPVRAWYVDRWEFADVPFSGEWIELLPGATVKLEPGSRLRRRTELVGAGGLQLRLTGPARIRLDPPDTDRDGLPNLRPVEVRTRGGTLAAVRGELTVTTRGDPTIVEALRLENSAATGLAAYMPTVVMLDSPTDPNPFMLRQGDRGRLVRGQAPEKLP